jgi:hypothetical protein
MEIVSQVDLGLATEWGDWELRVCQWSDDAVTVEALRKVTDGPLECTEENNLIYPVAPSLAKIRDDLDRWEQNKAEAAFEWWLRSQYNG